MKCDTKHKEGSLMASMKSGQAGLNGRGIFTWERTGIASK